MQLDLFMHSVDVGLRNAVSAALCSRDPAAMREAIDRLRATFPDDASLAGFEQLFIEFSALGPPGASASAIAQQLEHIETRLLPPLQGLLGSNAAQCWVAVAYGELARAARGQAFNRKLAMAHAAALFLRAGELALARAAVADIPSGRRIPVVLGWMTEIALRENSPEHYWPLLAELAWIAPTRLGGLLTATPRGLAPETVLRLHREFCSVADADGEEDETVWFPSWLLVEHAELLPLLRTAQPHDSRPARSAALLVDLLLGERQGVTPKMLDKRKKLNDLAPLIFAQYMARR